MLILRYEATRVILMATMAFVTALLATPFWLRLLERYQFGKQIRGSDETPVYSQLHEKKAGTPTAGGVIIWGTVIFLALVFWGLSAVFEGPGWDYLNFVNRRETYLPLAALLLTALLGLLDDWWGVRHRGGANGGGLKVRHKLILYALIAMVGAWWFYFKLDFHVLFVPFMRNPFDIGPWYILVFLFVLIASAFSANETDGLDGLLGGVTLFAFVALTAVAFVLRSYNLAVFGGAMMGALLAFLWFNIYPAKFFMGDTGAMSLGITIGTIAMLTHTELLLPLFAPILVIESLSVIFQLVSKKLWRRKIFISTPLHHHFEALGWPESQVTMRFWIVSAVLSSLGVVLFFLSKLS